MSQDDIRSSPPPAPPPGPQLPLPAIGAEARRQRMIRWGIVGAVLAVLLCVWLAPRASSGSTTVYITNTGKKYHRAGCDYLRKSEHAIPREEAIMRGYTPCSKCNP